MNPEPTAANERLAYTPQEFAKRLNMSKDSVYRAIAAGEIKAVKFGRLYRIPVGEATRLFGKTDAA